MLEKDYEVIRTKTGDEIGETIRVLKGSEKKIAALIVPEETDFFRSEVNLKLLQFYAKDLGKDIVLISDNKVVKDIGSRLGIQVFDKGRESSREKVNKIKTQEENKKEKNPVSENKWVQLERKAVDTEREPVNTIRDPNSGRFIYWFTRLAAVVLIGLSIALYFFFPRTTLVVNPATQVEIKEIILLVMIDEDIGENMLKGQLIDVEFEAISSVATSGEVLEGKSRAVGEVTFINHGDDDTTIPSGTLISTQNGIEFRTIDTVNIPSSDKKYLEGVLLRFEAGYSLASIEAVEKGGQGNVERGKITRIVAGDHLPGIEVTNEIPITGGKDDRLKMVTLEDIEYAEAKLGEGIREATMDKVTSILPPETYFLEDTIDIHIEEIVFTSGFKDVADEVTAIARISATGVGIDKRDFEQSVYERFNWAVTDDRELVDGTLKISSLSADSRGDGVIEVFLTTEGITRSQVDTSYLVGNIAGLRLNKAKEILETMRELAGYRITAFGDREPEILPKYPTWIRVVVQEDSLDRGGLL